VLVRNKCKRPTDSPTIWRALTAVDAAIVAAAGKTIVTGDFPDELRGKPVILAANHIGVFDPFVLIAACRRLGVHPQFLLAGGILDTPVLGALLRTGGHIRVDRKSTDIAEAFDTTVAALRTTTSPIAVFPEGRITHDPLSWPERGKTGAVRMALAADVPIIPVSQWGAHEAAFWGTETVTGWQDVKPVAASFARGVLRRGTFKVHFGAPLNLTDFTPGKPGHANKAHARLMTAITEGLIPLREAELDHLDIVDPTRPTDSTSPWRPE
jgi:1-acyl-sn-glycerol-3-phosphate acyltransferase